MINKIPLIVFFFLALVFALFSTALFPRLHTLPFAPFIPLVISRHSLVKSLWLAAFVGFCMDLLTSQASFGLYSLCFTLTTAVLYRHKWHFFMDKPIGLPSFTFLFALISTPIHLVLLSIFGKAISISAQSLFSDFLMMPIIDGVYAFLWFNCPIIWYYYIKKTKPHLLLYQKLFKRNEA